MNKKRGKVFALFKDFARAFSSVPHDKLWDKLEWLGVSCKLIRILKSLYEKFSTVIKIEYGYSGKIDITEGLLQGEICSPILFNLYISDIESHLNEKGIFGVKITHDFQLQLLCFADDMTILASTPGELQRKINELRAYFISLSLEVNVDKTKIVIFSKGGKKGKSQTFMYGDLKIQEVDTYTY